VLYIVLTHTYIYIVCVNMCAISHTLMRMTPLHHDLLLECFLFLTVYELFVLLVGCHGLMFGVV
jgi:hypothetical protein